MASNIGKTPKKAGGRFNTVATSTPSKSEAKLQKSESSTSQAGQMQRTPVRGGALFHHASPGFHEDEEPVCQDNSSTIKVFVRVRPTVESDSGRGGDGVVSVPTTDTVLLHGSEPKPFTFDYAADPTTTQQEMFNMIGKPFTDSCLAGYNGSIFAYGQTGSGKTYTMQGPEASTSGGGNSEQRGLIPRTLEYLFDRIAQKQAVADAVKPGSLQFTVRCAYLEIYNETVTDLLDPSKVNLTVRENAREGVYVDGISWQDVRTAEQTGLLLQRGVRNRHVAETSMNKESSRSHSLFTLKIESTLQTPEGLTKERHSCLNLVDLAGSERQKSTNATGDRLKEASNINKSLSALGNVIMALADISDGKARHVHYRDSKLTFLLKDSLGGNSKTAIIANVTASDVNFGETLSTLKFAQRAKLIKTRAILNEDTNGSVEQLRIEIKRLKDELFLARNNGSAGLASMPPSLSRIDSEPYASSAGSTTPPRSSSESGGKLGASEHAAALQARIRDLENALYQCLERQFEGEEKLAAVEEAAAASQALLREQPEGENQLFQALRMQLRLKEELVQHLRAGREGAEEEEEGEAGRVRQELRILEEENAALREAQAAPLAWHPEYRRVAVENAELVLMLQRQAGTDPEAIKHVDAINRELREQFIAAARDKAALHAQLQQALADAAAAAGGGGGGGGGGGSSGAEGVAGKRLSAMTSPERREYDSLALQKWREAEGFAEEREALQGQLDLLARENEALRAQAEASERRARVAAAEVAELKPALRRLSAGEGSEVEEIEKRAREVAEARASLEVEAEGRRASDLRMAEAEERVARLEAEVREGAEAVQAAAKREGTLRHQLQAAEYATQALERRANRASAGADMGRLGRLQEEKEALQQRVDTLQDEYDSHKEEFAFMQSKVQRMQGELAQQEAAAKESWKQLEQARGEAKALEEKLAAAERMSAAEKGEEGQRERLEAEVREGRSAVAESKKREEEARRREAELRDGLAHQQAVHEALQQEAQTMRGVLKETYANLEGKGALVEQLQAELNDKTSEVKELSEQLQGALAAQDRGAQLLTDTKRRHEALLEDREGVEADHQRQMGEMMAELRKRQERIKALEAEVSRTRDSFSEAQRRLSDLEGQTEELARLGEEAKALQQALQEKEVELFESNFDVQSLHSKVKKLETEREEQAAHAEEAAHNKEQLQSWADKLSDQVKQHAAVQERAEKLGGEVEELRGVVRRLEGERETMLAQIEGMAKEVTSAAERAMDAEGRVKGREGGDGGRDALGKLAEAQRENAELKERMQQWLEDMKRLNEQEDAAWGEAKLKAEEAGRLRGLVEEGERRAREAERAAEELREENARLVGHQNAKQKVQHTVKIKEENNALKTQLQGATSELSKAKDRAARFESEVNKLRAALGVEGGAAEVLAEEEKVKVEAAARERENASLRAELEGVAETLKGMAPAGGAGDDGEELEARVRTAVETVRAAISEHARQLEAKEGELKSREFQNGLLRKELQLHKGPLPADDENRHPNSPMTRNSSRPSHNSPVPPKTPKTPLRTLQA